MGSKKLHTSTTYACARPQSIHSNAVPVHFHDPTKGSSTTIFEGPFHPYLAVSNYRKKKD